MSRMQFTKEIGSDFLAQVERELVSIFTQRNVRARDRLVNSRLYSFLFVFARLLSGVGLALSLWVLATCPGRPKEMLIFGLFALAFTLVLVLLWNKKRLLGKLSGVNVRFSTWVSKKMAHRMLKVAKRMAPFLAEYDLRGKSAVYYRTQDSITQLTWTRNIQGLSMKGNGFTLFFKKETTVYPHILIMHDASPEWDANLDELGIKPIAETLSMPARD